MKPDDQRRFFERSLKHSISGARLKSLKLMPADMLDVSGPQCPAGILRCDVIRLRPRQSHGQSAFDRQGLWRRPSFSAAPGLSGAKYPMQTWVTYGLTEAIPSSWARLWRGLSLLSYAPVEDPCLDYHQTYSLTGRFLDCSREFKLKVVEFTPAQYQRLKQTLKQLDSDARKAPILATPAPHRQLQPTAVAAAPDGAVESNAESSTAAKNSTLPTLTRPSIASITPSASSITPARSAKPN